MSELAPVVLRSGQLPDLCNRLVGYELGEGQVGVIATSRFGIEHVAALDAGAVVDGADLLARLGADVDVVYVVGFGLGGASAASAWARDLNQLVDVPVSIGVQGGRWVSLREGEVGVGGPVAAVPNAIANEIPVRPLPTAEEVKERLRPSGPPHDVAVLQAHAAHTYVPRLAQMLSPVERVATAERILAAWDTGADIEADIAQQTGLASMGSTALFCELVEEAVVRDAVIATAIERPELVQLLVRAAKAADGQTSVGVTTAAGVAIWLTGSDGAGPVGSAAVAQMLGPVRGEPLAGAVWEAAIAGEDPRPVAEGVKEASEVALDGAEHAWVLSHARQGPTKGGSRTSIAGLGNIQGTGTGPEIEGVL